MSYSWCRICGKQLPRGTTDSEDGFCSGSPPYCFARFRGWAEQQAVWSPGAVYFNSLVPNTPEYQVLIDAWLEKGAP